MEVLLTNDIESRIISDWSMAYFGEQAALSAIAGLSSVEEVIRKLKEDDLFVESFIAGCQQQILDAEPVS